MNCIFKKIVFLLLLSPAIISAQHNLEWISTDYDDAFFEWTITTDSLEGELDMRNIFQEDWSEWDYSYEDESFGQIKLKWKQDPSLWELRGDNQIITARTIFKGDFLGWRITDNERSVELRSKFRNMPIEWEMKSKKYGNLFIYQDFEGDPREWVIEDYTENLDIHFKTMIVFIALIHSVPR